MGSFCNSGEVYPGILEGQFWMEQMHHWPPRCSPTRLGRLTWTTSARSKARAATLNYQRLDVTSVEASQPLLWGLLSPCS